METIETRKEIYRKILRDKKITKKEETQKKVGIKKNKNKNNEEKAYLKKNEVCFFSPNFKLASK
jgi:hypothetical protein